MGAFRGARTLAHARASGLPSAGARTAAVSVAVSASAGNARAQSAAGQPTQKQIALAALGKRAFFDPNLSEPPGLSCAGCHDPKSGFAGENGSENGLARGSRAAHFARRNTPSVLYLKYVRPFHFHWEEDAPLPDAAGGFFWDGRSDSITELVVQPLTNPDEMGNRDADQVADKMRASDYAAELATLLDVKFDRTKVALDSLGRAIEAFLLSDEMTPFTSKYDDFVRGKVELTAEEQRGLALFKDPAKGNCASCHKLNDKIPQPARSLFTDYGYEVVAVPRNRRLERSQSGAEKPRDLGLCERRDPAQLHDETRFCGAFRTPSLRNVALRSSYMHNGAFTSLREVVEFYATRGTDPKRWYPSGERYDDLPKPYRANVNSRRPPYDRGEHEAARLTPEEIQSIVAFLEILTDERMPGSPTLH
ncbi:MAG TPA: cytochrome c peroxidase [Polyangiaceae bacterium]|nr:cytochrome c peroxidase [Polyangiaceae bacterium]